MATRIPHLCSQQRRNGATAWYWRPAPALRKAGWVDRRLSDDPALAAREAERINDEVERWRTSKASGRERNTAPIPGTFHALTTAYLEHDDYLLLGDRTRDSYRDCIDVLAAKLGSPKLRAITPPVVQALKRNMAKTPRQANLTLAVLRLLFSFGIREGYVTTANPAAKFRQLRTRPRHQVWSHADEEAFLAVATPEMRLAFLLAVYTAQRQGDLLALLWSAWDGHSLTLRQSKTGRPLIVPAPAPLAVALKVASRPSTHILTCNGVPWKEDWFRHCFSATRRLAGVDRALQFLDLRRTGIVRLAEAGCTTPEITAISGHTIDYAERILETYLPRSAGMAKAAVVKLDRASRMRARTSHMRVVK